MDKQRRISISFKNTKRDTELYNALINMEDRSYEIKRVLRKAFIDVKKEEKVIEKDNDILGF